MKYLCLVYLEEQKLHAVPDSECVACSAVRNDSGSVCIPGNRAVNVGPITASSLVRSALSAVTICSVRFSRY